MPAAQRIGVVVGSLRRDSFNRRLAQALASMAPDGWALEIVEIRELPLYDQDDDGSPAEPVRRFKERIAGCRGVIFVTPEYNRSIPGVLKNALDHGSRPYGRGVWSGKPAGVLGISPGALGTALAQQHLRSVLASLAMPTLAQPEVYLQARDGFFAADGGIADDATRRLVQGWLDAFVAWVQQQADA
ncbi:NADPH-dependent FMN reductase [Rubrivivax gelatinosus]|uniref:Chromate reductase n=1 Tax=Rubrivivax gelatinosus TaxID=28068 RepID=A0A4R2LVJ4_RUBGE|nr:NAD(P)H-dependent oxidoreductase [Rubrivivax gelatinosus]MBK1690264.1 NADPH-dependent FMN reductase [Rubrivivax gelatinosus]TCO97650.1 chromate reductase [Rubrivivax gelatinosus]